MGCEKWYSLVRATSHHCLTLPAPAAPMFSAALANKCVKFTGEAWSQCPYFRSDNIYESSLASETSALFLVSGTWVPIAVSSQRYLHTVVR